MAEAPSDTNNWSYATFAAAFDVAHQSLAECVAYIVVADILSVVLQYVQKYYTNNVERTHQIFQSSKKQIFYKHVWMCLIRRFRSLLICLE
jgi:hypothetical protein